MTAYYNTQLPKVGIIDTGKSDLTTYLTMDILYISSAAVVIQPVTLDNFQISDSYINVLLFITFKTVGKLGLKNKNQRKEAHSQTDGITGDAAPATSSSSSNPQISEQIQTSHGTRFFTDPRDNDFTNATITIYKCYGPASETNKITPDIIASAIPAVPNIFKGREELVEQGVNILCQQGPGFLAILGAGGMGKTSLALHIMNSASVKNKFAGRSYFIPCELFENAESLVLGLIHVMELTMQENQSKQKVLFEHLQAAHRDVLIAFDNFETPWNHDDSAGVRNLLEKIAQYAKVSLIVTMRGPDGPGDIPWEKLGDQSGIPTLAPVPAKEAFKAFAGSNPQSSDDSEAQIDSLLNQLDYVPLAIRLSAQHVRRVKLKALISMWKKGKTSILTEGRVPGRLTSIFKIEGRTLKLLSAISFLPDGVPFWMKYLPQVFQGEELSFNVSTLLDSSLINENYEGIKMLAPVREHIDLNHPISKDDVDQLEKFYIQFLEDLPENDMEAQPVLQLHINNIEKIFKAQISGGHPITSYISAVKKLAGFGRFVPVSIDLMDLILQKNKDIKEEDKVDLKLIRAYNLCWMGRFQDAEAQVMSVKECFNEEENISQSEADILGRCFETLQHIFYAQDQYEKAINMNQQAQKYFKQSENQWAQANSMYWLGDINYMQDRYKKASEIFSEAQQLFQQIENELGVAECLKKLGDIYSMQDRYDEAIEMLSDAQKQFETFGNQLRAAECLWSLGDLYRRQGEYDEATGMILKAQKQYKEIGYKDGVADCLWALGDTYDDQAQYDKAVDMFSNAQRQYQIIGKIVDVAWCYQRLGITYGSQGQYEKANEAFTEALELLKGFPGEKCCHGGTLLHFGHLFLDMKDFAEARRKYEEARDIFDSHGQLEKEVDYCSLAKLDQAEAAG
ncbi:TPR-like protein [Dendrothele bispora CBS 962.96]|uniref:TPR-like protein n=1 Tax=Dendrothele bispora (strain CBS 962.96) TaxID=1314807 RepID=A0A4S8LJ23_DENBC|nr:TPR-like protein [Dendrothele bispora CBS 962.96]